MMVNRVSSGYIGIECFLLGYTMDTSNHFTLTTLFDQLGLPSEPDQIDTFFQAHKLSAQQRIEQADFWSDSQSSFLREAIAEDSDWAELVDQLDASLRQN